MSRYAKLLLSDQGQSVIDRWTAQGMSAGQVIDAALSAFEIVQNDPELKRAVLRAEIEKGTRSAEARQGRMIDGPEEARRFRDELVQQGRERMAKAQADWLMQIRAELDASEGSPAFFSEKTSQ